MNSTGRAQGGGGGGMQLAAGVDIQALKSLRAYCDKNRVIRCSKLNNTGIGWNERNLRISATTVEYFKAGRNVSEILLKARVPLSAVIQLTDPKNAVSQSIAKNCITFTFPAAAIVSYKNGVEIEKSEAQKKSIGHLMWVFRIESKYGDPFVSSNSMGQTLSMSVQPQETVQEQRPRPPQQQQPPQQITILPPPPALPVVSDFIQFDSEAEIKDDNKIDQAALDEENLQKAISSDAKKKERMRIQWDYRFDKLWEDYYAALREGKTDTDSEIQFALKLFAFLGEFREFCVSNVSNIVKELIFPQKWRQYKEVRSDHVMYQFKQKNEVAYLVNGIFIRLSYVIVNRNINGPSNPSKLGNDNNINMDKLQLPQLNQQLSQSQQQKQSQYLQDSPMKMKQGVFNFEERRLSKDQPKGVQPVDTYTNLQTKLMAHEFRTNSILADSIHQLLLSTQQMFSLRVPLTCQVDYLGFTCICSTVAPLLLPPRMRTKTLITKEEQELGVLLRQEENVNNQSLICGLRRTGEYLEYSKDRLSADLISLGQFLRLKPFAITGFSVGSTTNYNKQIEVCLSLFAEVHCLKNSEMVLNEVKHQVLGETMKQKQKRIRILNSKQKKNDKTDIQDHFKFYLFKTATIMPLEIDLEQASKQPVSLFQNRLRPEFLGLISSFLSNGAFINQNTSVNTSADDMLLVNAGLKLKNEAINKLVRDLETMQIQPIGTEQLSAYFHQYGVNMRHLGKVATRTDMPYIKEICITDMIARSSKKILRANLAEFILYRYSSSNCDQSSGVFAQLRRIFQQNDGYEGQVLIQQQNDDDYDYDDERYQEMMQREEEQDRLIGNELYEEEREFQNHFNEDIEELKEKARTNFEKFLQPIFIDYLNLVFSQDQESIHFWDQCLKPQIEQDFGFKFTAIQPQMISSGYLLHAICYHWRIYFKQEETMKIFTPVQPFDETSTKIFIGYHSRIYQYKSLAAVKLIQDSNECIQLQQLDLAEKYKEIQRQMLILTKDTKLTAPAPKKENCVLIEIQQLEFKKMTIIEQEYLERVKENENDTDEPIQKTKKSMRKGSYWLQKQNSQIPTPQYNQAQILAGYNAIEQFVTAQLNSLPYNHAERIKAMTTIIQLYQQQMKLANNEEVSEKKNNDCMDMFQKIQQLIEYHLGTHHPLIANLYGMQSEYHFSVDKFEQGQKYLQEAIKKSKTILGGNHIRVSELYQKQAKIYLSMNQNYKALQFLENSKAIIESQFGIESINAAQIYFEISQVYFSTSRLQNGFDICDKAYKIFLQKESKYLTQCLNCCYQCCKASLDLLQPKEVIEYSDKIWHLMKKYYYDKILKKQLKESLTEFIFKAVIKIIIYTMKLDERNFLFSVMLFHTMKIGSGSDSENVSRKNSRKSTINSIDDNSILLLPEEESDGQLSNLDLNNIAAQHEHHLQTSFDQIREQHRLLHLNDPSLIERVGLYPDNRIYDPETYFELEEEKKIDPELRRRKRDFLDDLLQKDSQDDAFDLMKNMFNDLQSRRKYIPQKDFFENYRKFLLKNQDERSESMELYRTFLEIFGNLFFYQLYKSTIYINVKILDYDQR